VRATRPSIGASILTAIYHMLKDGTLYQDLGSNHFQNRSKGQQTNRLIKRLADLGCDVALIPRTS
jgi:transposase